MHASMAICAISSRVGFPTSVSGARESVSEVYIFFPGVWLIVKSKRSRRRRNRSTRGGSVLRCFELNSETSGLW